TSPVGGAYTLGTPKDFRVGPEVATVSLPFGGATRSAWLQEATSVDTVVGTTFAVPALPTRGRLTTAVVLRQTSTMASYQARVHVSPDGAAVLELVRRAADGTLTQLAPPTSVGRLSAGQWYRVESRVTGSDPVTLRARSWVRGAAVPDWQVSTKDSSGARLTGAGSVGFSTLSTRDAAKAEVLADNFAATCLDVQAPAPAPPAPAPEPAPAPVPAPVPPAPAPVPPAPAPEPAPPAPAPTEGREAASAGTEVGSTRYPVPANAVVVAPNGDDSAAGTASAPFRTVARAIAAAPSGATVVLRAGSYHESVAIRKQLTIQSWPGEQVWFDGSRVVSSWSQRGSAWTAPWTPDFDASPTYTWGASEAGAASGWRFVDPSYPMAAHPDQVWVDGVAQKQVGSLSQVTPGSFYLDRAGDVMHLGTDPRGKEVRVSDLQQVINVRSAGTVLRGFGVRRYAPSVPHMGALTVEQPKVTLENLAVLDSATTGIAIASTAANVRDVTIARSGLLGMTATYSDGLVVDGLRSEGNNVERFNMSPVSGGLKIARSRGITVKNSAFLGNRGPGLWLDESVYDVKVVSNDMRDNVGHGTSLELSAKAVFADNVVANNGRDGVKVNNTSDVKIWNNTFTGNGRSINLVQDGRRASQRSTPGHNPRRPYPDPTMTWVLGPVSVHNNVVANPRSGNCLLCVEDYSKERSAEQIGVTADANVYNRASRTAPTWAVVWSRGPGNPQVFTELGPFTSATGREKGGVLMTGAAVVDAKGTPTATLPSHSRAVGLPSDIAGLVNQPTSAKRLGAFDS
ncbi:right-handed parallel beta-helix repeat-containing protein, partial [Pseudokineococcus sp. 1T1Z-3]|uniref:right-handed parallel beta-helix repeat-containing protein n=1 Tax=Pseudokineococcus sp. 1T1Z-3 TaxID=3132745 RepID=UPI0030A79609